MTTRMARACSRLKEALGSGEIDLSVAGVKLFGEQEVFSQEVTDHLPTGITLTCCQAVRQACLGDPVLLTVDNIGCIASAISLGLVDQSMDRPLKGPRVYTEIMRNQSGAGGEFEPPTPKDFTDGTVYACRSAERPEFCLFGKEDSGRFKDVETARLAISEMAAIQPAVTKGVFFYPPEFEDMDLVPDVVILSVRPVELTRIVQAWAYNTGRRVTASMGPLRAVCSDLIARSHLRGEMNVSSYCLGSRIIAQYEANHVGIGMPFELFETMVEGMEASKKGYPFHLYPGARG